MHELDETFAGDDLDPAVWFPYYLPHWSSRAASAATYQVRDGELRLSTSADQPVWCHDRHPEPMRVSCLQTGSYAGPLGSSIGQQPFAEALTVTEEQPTFWGYTPRFGSFEVVMRGTVGPRSMIAFWLSGIEDTPERCGEICVAEVFGDAIADGVAQVGMGVHRFRDPELTEEFATEPMRIDVSQEHAYGVDWRPGSLVFRVDGVTVRELHQAPDYPVQLMLGVFEFPARYPGLAALDPTPELVVRRVRGRQLA